MYQLSADTFARNTLAGEIFWGERLDSCRGHARAEVKKDSGGGPVAVRRQTGRKAVLAAPAASRDDFEPFMTLFGQFSAHHMETFRFRQGRRHSIDASRQDESNGGLSRPIGPSEPE